MNSAPLQSTCLTRLAVINVLFHMAALAGAYFGMRPGSPLAPLPDRLAYLASQPLGWSFCWVSWVISAFTMLTFTVATARKIGDDLARFAVGVGIAAVTIDLCCDAVFLGVFPWLAARSTASDIFVVVERTTTVVSLGVANTLYSFVVLILSAALWRQSYSRIMCALGFAVFVSGLLLSAAGFTGVPEHAQWATVPTIGGYSLWSLWAAWSLDRKRRET
jgi:uncharacterized membrane protein